ncbi:hypothetical protein J2738_003287 [Variovorax paradoxus]|jgi:hypothetical protein|uniref:Uncharacterized protein n=1 Tax=Variovorax paradoxus TaxID=34073 RepID=A0AAE3XYE6_VARPD|nr:hypothetical protein [Variovorax paradoxus]
MLAGALLALFWAVILLVGAMSALAFIVGFKSAP